MNVIPFDSADAEHRRRNDECVRRLSAELGRPNPLQQYDPLDRCHRCGTTYAEHKPQHLFVAIPAGELREYVLTDQGARYVAHLNLFGWWDSVAKARRP